MKRFFFTDPATGGGAPAEPVDTHIRHQGNIPAKDAELLNVCSQSDEQWKLNTNFTLVWITEAEFATDVQNFKNLYTQRQSTGVNLPQISHDIDELDRKTDDAVSFVKTYILEKFGPKDGPSHYAAFGFEHKHNHFQFPTQRQKRLESLNLMTAAIASNGFGTKTYGTTFWTDLRDKYNSLINSASDTSGDVSEDVSELVQLRTKLRRVLHSLLLLLEANYPDTFDQMRRKWGFQKEKY